MLVYAFIDCIVDKIVDDDRQICEVCGRKISVVEEYKRK